MPRTRQPSRPEPVLRTRTKETPIRALSSARWIAVTILTIALVAPAWYIYAGQRTVVTVDGGSMAPVLQRGDVVIIGPLSGDGLHPGMIVTVRGDDQSYYTHRIDSIDADGRIHLKGDANPAVDVSTRYPDDVLGAVQNILTPPWGTILVQLQLWPLRLSVLVTILGLALLPLRRRSDDADQEEWEPVALATAPAEVHAR
ncbi:signal peptidase I [Amnibacterium flavum]|uniref:signal peptidase I n=1 Tax=Amnibacterium flavum TaxID=2173173 RepID=UPI0014034E14|nr:signal peptidase I [Amnibacterium flavum]